MRKENACPDFKVENFRCKLLKKTAANKAEVINFIFREEKKARQASHVIVQSALRFPPEGQFVVQWEFCLYSKCLVASSSRWQYVFPNRP